MKTVADDNANTNLSHLIAKARREQRVIKADGKERGKSRNRKPGAWRGKIVLSDDAFAPLTGQELKDVGF